MWVGIHSENSWIVRKTKWKLFGKIVDLKKQARQVSSHMCQWSNFERLVILIKPQKTVCIIDIKMKQKKNVSNFIYQCDDRSFNEKIAHLNTHHNGRNSGNHKWPNPFEGSAVLYILLPEMRSFLIHPDGCTLIWNATLMPRNYCHILYSHATLMIPWYSTN